MSYIRVIPRDLFNDANLLKCVGAMYLILERFALPNVELDHDGEAFNIEQNEDDGSTFVQNVTLIVRDEIIPLIRPMNSRDQWPLYALVSGEEIPVFGGEGQFSEEFASFLHSDA